MPPQVRTNNSPPTSINDPQPVALSWPAPRPTGLLVLQSGLILEGVGLGAQGTCPGEICFNTAMTGYQEILTDPSYAEQIVTFTFPHIGNVGTNEEDMESANPAAHCGACGVVLHCAPGLPSNWRAQKALSAWLEGRGIIGIVGIDTRALTNLIREKGMQNGLIVHAHDGIFDRARLLEEAKAWGGMEGRDLVPQVATRQRYAWSADTCNADTWRWRSTGTDGSGFAKAPAPRFHVVAVDYGIKATILRLLVHHGCKVSVVPPQTPAEDILALNPDGVFLSNGPGDPFETGRYAVPIIKELLEADVPMFGICLGHQMLGLAVGAKTVKMHQGHHGANHPVRETTTGKVEIVSMNHGFAVDAASLPKSAVETHVSLFDGTNCGFALKHKPVFSVQHHPEASPGPMDSHYLFARFVAMMKERTKTEGRKIP